MPATCQLRRLFYVCALAACAFAAASGARAAVLTGAAVASPTSPANLTELGTTDWAYWSSQSTISNASLAATNDQSGPSLISPATPVGGTGIRGSSTTLTDIKYDFTDGTSPTTGDDLAVRGVFNFNLDTVGRGVAVSVTLPDTQLYEVLVWVSGFNSSGQFTATLPGASNYQNSSFTYTAPKVAKLYQLQVQANQPGDLLNLSYTMSADNGDNAHVLLGGVALSVIPEPGSLLLLSAAGLFVLPRRRHV